MRKHLQTAHYGRKHLSKDDYGVNDNKKIYLNMKLKFSQKMLEQLLFHEILHWNVRRVILFLFMTSLLQNSPSPTLLKFSTTFVEI